MLQTKRSTIWRFVLQTVSQNFLLIKLSKEHKNPMVAASTNTFLFIRQILWVSLAKILMPFGCSTQFFRYSTGFYTYGLTENSLKTGESPENGPKIWFLFYILRYALPKKIIVDS